MSEDKKGSILSRTVELEINRLVDARIKKVYTKSLLASFLKLEAGVEKLQETVEHADFDSSVFLEISKRLSNLEEDVVRLDIASSVSEIDENDLKNIVAKVILEIMPEFKERISREIKLHLSALAEYAFTNFKLKE